MPNNIRCWLCDCEHIVQIDWWAASGPIWMICESLNGAHRWQQWMSAESRNMQRCLHVAGFNLGASMLCTLNEIPASSTSNGVRLVSRRSRFFLLCTIVSWWEPSNVYAVGQLWIKCVQTLIPFSGRSRKQSRGVLSGLARRKFLLTTPTFPKPHFNL